MKRLAKFQDLPALIALTALTSISASVQAEAALTSAKPAPGASQNPNENGEKKDPVDEMLANYSMASQEITSGRHDWIAIGAQTNWLLTDRGINLEVGHRWDFFGVDLRGSYGKTAYKGIAVGDDSGQATGPIWSSASNDLEVNRPRGELDPWRYTLVEPGFSVSGKLFPKLWPLLTERARVGLEWGKFNDEANSMPFTAYIFTAEGALIYQLGKNSPFSLSGSLRWSTGTLISKIDESPSLSDRHLPVSWVGSSFSIVYFFR